MVRSNVLDIQEIVKYITDKYNEIEWGYQGRNFVHATDSRGFYVQGDVEIFKKKYQEKEYNSKYFLINGFSKSAIKVLDFLRYYVVITEFTSSPSTMNIEVTKNNKREFLEKNVRNRNNYFFIQQDEFRSHFFLVDNVENFENLFLQKLGLQFETLEEFRNQIVIDTVDWNDLSFYNTFVITMKKWNLYFNIHINPQWKKTQFGEVNKYFDEIRYQLKEGKSNNFDNFNSIFTEFKKISRDKKGTFLNDNKDKINSLFCSLGSLDYYKFLKKYLKSPDRKAWFEISNDLAYNNVVFKNFVELFDSFNGREDGYNRNPIVGNAHNFFNNAFLRNVTPDEINEVYHPLTVDQKSEVKWIADGKVTYDFSSFDDKWKGIIEFNKKFNSLFSENVYSIIGSNGSGKTQLINKIIDNFEKTRDFLKIVHFSLSPFDSFNRKIEGYEKIGVSKPDFKKYEKLKGLVELSKENLSEEVANGILVSLETEFEGRNTDFTVENYFSCYIQELILNLINPKNADELTLWKESLEYFAFEPWAKDILDSFNDRQIDKSDFDMINKLSSGQKTILLFITKMVLNVGEGYLIIFDEPETFMHPPMMKAFVRSVQRIMSKKNAICLIATHSPIIIQEIPHNFIYRIKKFRDMSLIDKMEYKTYGENLDSIYKNIYGVEFRRTGYFEVLRDLAEELGYESFNNLDIFSLGDEALLRYCMLNDTFKTKDGD